MASSDAGATLGSAQLIDSASLKCPVLQNPFLCLLGLVLSLSAVDSGTDVDVEANNTFFPSRDTFLHVTAVWEEGEPAVPEGRVPAA